MVKRRKRLLEPTQRDAIIALTTHHGWPAYQQALRELLEDWEGTINDPNTALDLTAVLRFARTRLLEIIEVPADALDELREEKEDGRSGEQAPGG